MRFFIAFVVLILFSSSGYGKLPVPEEKPLPQTVSVSSTAQKTPVNSNISSNSKTNNLVVKEIKTSGGTTPKQSQTKAKSNTNFVLKKDVKSNSTPQKTVLQQTNTKDSKASNSKFVLQKETTTAKTKKNTEKQYVLDNKSSTNAPKQQSSSKQLNTQQKAKSSQTNYTFKGDVKQKTTVESKEKVNSSKVVKNNTASGGTSGKEKAQPAKTYAFNGTTKQSVATDSKAKELAEKEELQKKKQEEKAKEKAERQRAREEKKKAKAREKLMKDSDKDTIVLNFTAKPKEANINKNDVADQQKTAQKNSLVQSKAADNTTKASTKVQDAKQDTNNVKTAASTNASTATKAKTSSQSKAVVDTSTKTLSKANDEPIVLTFPTNSEAKKREEIKLKQQEESILRREEQLKRDEERLKQVEVENSVKVDDKTFEKNIATAEVKSNSIDKNKDNFYKSSNDRISATTTADSVNIVRRIESNMMAGNINNTPQKEVNIQRGGWTRETLLELDESGEEIKKSPRIEIITKENPKDIKIAEFKRQAYDAVSANQYEIAIELYKKILKLDPKDSYTKTSLAIAYHRLGQYRQAKPLYLELLDVFPNDERLMSNLLSIITEENPYEAVYLLSSLASKNETSPTIQAQTSVAYANIKKYDDAIRYIQKALLLDPVNIDYLYNLAVLYDLSKQYVQALEMYKEVITVAEARQLKHAIPYNNILARLAVLEKYR